MPGEPLFFNASKPPIVVSSKFFKKDLLVEIAQLHKQANKK